jgi:hypothetical protein
MGRGSMRRLAAAYPGLSLPPFAVEKSELTNDLVGFDFHFCDIH